MRKSLIALLVLLLMAIGFLTATARVVDEQKDEIAITETTLTGDPAVVEGLVVTVGITDGDCLLWETSYEAGTEPNATTEFTFGDVERETPVWRYDDFMLEFANLNYGMSGTLGDLEEQERGEREYGMETHMLLPVIDVANRTASGETRTETLRLADYYDYFRIGVTYNWGRMYNMQMDQSEEIRALNDYFRIPIPEDLMVDITVTRNEYGDLEEVECWEVLNEAYERNWNGGFATITWENGAFFVIQGDCDVSQVKGGYGVYWLPVGERTIDGETRKYLDLEHLQNVYPLDAEAVDDVQILSNPEQTQLYLIIRERETYTLFVLDGKTMQETQKIVLGELEEMPTAYMEHNVVMLCSGNYEKQAYRMQVFERQGARLVLWLDTEQYPLNDEGYWYREPVLHFNGEKLVVGAFRERWDIASHRLTVYDRTGLLYAGDYYHTADELPNRLYSESPGGLRMEWQK